MENREKLSRIGPDARELKTRRGRERGKSLDRMFVGKFRDDFFAGSEIKFTSAKVHGLLTLAEQVHLDARGPEDPGAALKAVKEQLRATEEEFAAKTEMLRNADLAMYTALRVRWSSSATRRCPRTPSSCAATATCWSAGCWR